MCTNSNANHRSDDDGMNDEKNTVTPLKVILAGTGVLASGAVITGTAHYHGTAKQLKTEGIPASARHRAFPLAAKALGLSTIMCLSLAAGASVFWKLMGGEYKADARVATVSAAVQLVNEQRVRILLYMI